MAMTTSSSINVNAVLFFMAARRDPALSSGVPTPKLDQQHG
jgi:hypothetical protein